MIERTLTKRIILTFSCKYRLTKAVINEATNTHFILTGQPSPRGLPGRHAGPGKIVLL